MGDDRRVSDDDATGRLPADDHVHSEWSWDTDVGSMERTCARAVELGLPSVAFTEHADLSRWAIGDASRLPEHFRAFASDGHLTPPPLDVDGYLASLERCRDLFPSVRILSGVEMSEPHWHREHFDALLAGDRLQRRLASVHSARRGEDVVEVSLLYADTPPADVVRSYLAEAERLVEGFEAFDVLAHIDYPVRGWPAGGPPYDPAAFEDDYRAVLRALARRGKVLELNTRIPLHPLVLGWWREVGGAALSFASDAHSPDALATGFADASRTALAAGFRPGRDLLEPWVRD